MCQLPVIDSAHGRSLPDSLGSRWLAILQLRNAAAGTGQDRRVTLRDQSRQPACVGAGYDWLRWVGRRAGCCVTWALAAACGQMSGGEQGDPQRADTVRIATFNIQELDATKLSRLDAAGRGSDPQLTAAAAIIQRVRPDVLVLNEVDHGYGDGASLDGVVAEFLELYLASGGAGIAYPYHFVAPNNTGLLSGLDFNGDGATATEADLGTRTYGDDSFGYGEYPGQYSMAIVSRFPFAEGVRTFQRLLWRDLPGHHIPPGHLGDDAIAAFRLSSKSHWDVPVSLGDTRVHVFASHPTPPVFDGPEDRNGRRNFDEVKFWVEYLDDGSTLYDDAGVTSGYGTTEPFMIAGDLNAMPQQRESVYDGLPAIAQLLQHPRVRETAGYTTSRGALEGRRPGPPAHLELATAQFGGGSRVDYVLPSVDLELVGGGVFWPAADEDPEGRRFAEAASDHRMVWIDIVVRSPG